MQGERRRWKCSDLFRRRPSPKASPGNDTGAEALLWAEVGPPDSHAGALTPGISEYYLFGERVATEVIEVVRGP